MAIALEEIVLEFKALSDEDTSTNDGVLPDEDLDDEDDVDDLDDDDEKKTEDDEAVSDNMPRE